MRLHLVQCVAAAAKSQHVSVVHHSQMHSSEHTYLTGTYYVDLAGCGFMLRRCHCTPALLTHAITTNVRNSAV